MYGRRARTSTLTETRQLKGYLTATMAKSNIPKVQQYNNSLLLPENALKSYDEVYRVIGEDCARKRRHIPCHS